MERHDLTSAAFTEYELLDSGEHMKLERWGGVIIARPETQAIWKKAQPELWKQAHAEFLWGDKKGSWKIKRSLPEPWHIHYNDLTLSAKLTTFKHTGIFPEQAPNWEWITERIEQLKETRGRDYAPKVLNLFGYTGAATLAASAAGAIVTHVDASKQSLAWARDNAALSGMKDEIRFLLDDALGFVKREARRKNTYDGIILDPPAFGRGAKGEVWHIERDLPELMEILKTLLSEEPRSFFLINGYAAGYAPVSFLQMTEGVFGTSLLGEYGELHLKESVGTRVIPAGMYVRFVR